MRRLLIGVFIALVCLWALFPFYWAIVTSLKQGEELFRSSLIPLHPSFSNYGAIFTEQDFGKNLLNSLIVAVSTVAIATVLTLFAAYPLSRQVFPGRRFILMLFLFISMFPQIAILSGLFELIRALGLFNRKLSLVVSYLIFILPFTTWTLTVFMRDLPKGIEEAAEVDGAGIFTLILYIFLPMMVPAVVTTSILGFIIAWNEFLFALTFTLTDRARTVPVAIATLSGASEHEIPWGRIMAASVVVTIPVIAMVLTLQKRIVSGLTAGSMKG